MDIVGILKTVYLFILLPILLGAAVRRVERVRTDIFECYGVGIFAMMALYWVGSFIPLRRGITVSVLAQYGFIAASILGVVALVIGLIPGGKNRTSETGSESDNHAGKNSGYGLRSVFDETGAVFRRIKSNRACMIAAVILCVTAIGMIIVSIAVVRSDPADRVPETVAAMLQTDGFYTHDPYSLMAYEAPMVTRFPIESFFAVIAKNCSMDAYICMHVAMKAVLILAAYSIYLSLARRMTTGFGNFVVAGKKFHNDDQEISKGGNDILQDKEKVSADRTILRLIIMGTVILLFILELFHEGAMQFKFYQNIWYWETFVTCIAFPEIFAEVVILIDLFRNRLGRTD